MSFSMGITSFAQPFGATMLLSAAGSPLGESKTQKDSMYGRSSARGSTNTISIAGGCPSVAPEQLERMAPLIAAEARNQREHTQRLDGTGGLRAAHVGRLPAEQVEQVGHHGLGLRDRYRRRTSSACPRRFATLETLASKVRKGPC